MSKENNKTRHQSNKAILNGRHGSEGYLEQGQPRGGGRYTVLEQPVTVYVAHLLSPNEVLYNEGLLEVKPDPSEKIPSTRPAGKVEVTLFKRGCPKPQRQTLVDEGQVEIIENLWLSSYENGTSKQDVFPQDDVVL